MPGKKAFLAGAVAMVVLLGAGVAYPTNGSSEATPGTTTTGMIPTRAGSSLLQIGASLLCGSWPT